MRKRTEIFIGRRKEWISMYLGFLFGIMKVIELLIHVFSFLYEVGGEVRN